jgi:hypothetical protein
MLIGTTTVMRKRGKKSSRKPFHPVNVRRSIDMTKAELLKVLEPLAGEIEVFIEVRAYDHVVPIERAEYFMVAGEGFIKLIEGAR